MKAYQCKALKYKGTDLREIYRKARNDYKNICSKTKRRPYVRSSYFKKQKIFLKMFWEHLGQKNKAEETRRLSYYACAVDLIRHSKLDPASTQNPNKSNEILHRFTGITKKKDIFYVQIKEDKKTNMKWFMSVFPDKSNK